MSAAGDMSWGQEWRAQITREVESSAEKHERAAVIQERIMGILNDHTTRIVRLEQRPAGLRSDLSAYGGCLGQVVFAVFGSIGALGGLSGVVSVLWMIFHH